MAPVYEDHNTPVWTLEGTWIRDRGDDVVPQFKRQLLEQILESRLFSRQVDRRPSADGSTQRKIARNPDPHTTSSWVDPECKHSILEGNSWAMPRYLAHPLTTKPLCPAVQVYDRILPKGL